MQTEKVEMELREVSGDKASAFPIFLWFPGAALSQKGPLDLLLCRLKHLERQRGNYLNDLKSMEQTQNQHT